MGIIPAQLLVYIFTVRIAREAFFPEAVFHDFPPGTGMSFVSIAFLPISHFFLPDHLNKKNGASQGVGKKEEEVCNPHLLPLSEYHHICERYG